MLRNGSSRHRARPPSDKYPFEHSEASEDYREFGSTIDKSRKLYTRLWIYFGRTITDSPDIEKLDGWTSLMDSDERHNVSS